MSWKSVVKGDKTSIRLCRIPAHDLNKVINLEEAEGKFSTDKLKTSYGNDYGMAQWGFLMSAFPRRPFSVMIKNDGAR